MSSQQSAQAVLQNTNSHINNVNDQQSIERETEQLIRQELACIDQLNQLIEQESQAISRADTDCLHQILQQKQPLIIHLQQLDKQRQEIMTCQGVAPSAENFEQLIDNATNSRLPSMWLELKAALKQCKRNNEVNGKMIFMKKNNIERLLRVLLGNWQTQGQTYNPAGTANSYSKSGLCAVA